MPEHARRSPFRLLAPLALLVVAGAIVFVVMSNASSSSDGGSPAAPGTDAERTTTTDDRETRTEPKPRGNSYTVKTGDTLGGIAERTGVQVEQLLELNPDLDPQTLVAGQKIKLRE